MKKLKLFSLLAVMTAMLIFSNCQKDRNLDNMADENNTHPHVNPSGEITFRADGDCEAHDDFVDEFCAIAIAAPWPPVAVSLQAPPDNPELYAERAVTMFVDGDTVRAIPFRSMENEIDFRVEIGDSTYTLTKSADVVVGSKAMEGGVPSHLNAFFLIRDALMQETASAQDITSPLAGAGNAVLGTDGSVTLNITQKELLPSDGVGDMLLLKGCDWEKTRTINRYLSNIGWPNDDLSLYPFFVETALDDCGWQCGECLDPSCVFEGIEFFLSSQDDLDMLHQAFLKYSLNLTEEETQLLDEPENSQVSGLLLTFMQGDDFCRQHEVGVEIVDLLEDGVMQDACDNTSTQQDMLLSVMTENGFGDFGYDEFYNSLGENTDFVIRKYFEHCPKMGCVLDKLIDANGLCAEIIQGYEELEGDFDLIYHYDYNCMSHKFSPSLVYGPGCSFITGLPHGSNSFYVRTFGRGNCYEIATGEYVCNPYSLQLYNKHFCDSLSPIRMASFILHESLHSEFHQWVYGATGNNFDLLSVDYVFAAYSPLWRSIVEMKYGSETPTNHHKLMNEYFVPQIAEDLWAINGETDSTTIENYYYFAYDLLTPEDQMLVDSMFITQAELDNYKQLSTTVTSNTGCE